MARFYADEQFPYRTVNCLRSIGHDVLTVAEAGKAGLGIPDPAVLSFATDNDRAILTLDRRDFLKLHRERSHHAGIIICRDDRDRERLANRIHAIISPLASLQG